MLLQACSPISAGLRCKVFTLPNHPPHTHRKACGPMTRPARAQPSPPRQVSGELRVRPCACAAEAACMPPPHLGLSLGPAPDPVKETQDQRQPPPRNTVLGSPTGLWSACGFHGHRNRSLWPGSSVPVTLGKSNHCSDPLFSHP